MPSVNDEVEMLFAPYLQKKEDLIWVAKQVPKRGKYNYFTFKFVLHSIGIAFACVLCLGLVFGISWILFHDPRALIPVFCNLLLLLFLATRFDLFTPKGASFAITSKRVLIHDGISFQDYPLILLADAILSKPVNSLSKIYL